MRYLVALPFHAYLERNSDINSNRRRIICFKKSIDGQLKKAIINNQLSKLVAIVGFLQYTFCWNRQFLLHAISLQPSDRKVVIQRWEGSCSACGMLPTVPANSFREVAGVVSL